MECAWLFGVKEMPLFAQDSRRRWRAVVRIVQNPGTGTSLAVRGVKTWPSKVGGSGLIPGRGAKTPHGSGPKNQNTKQKQYCNKSTKDIKNGPHKKEILKK